MMEELELTKEELENAAKVAIRIDEYQKWHYSTYDEQAVRKEQPHSESEAYEEAKEVLDEFVHVSPPGNSVGVMMGASALWNSLAIVGRKKEAAIVDRIIRQHQEQQDE